MKISLALRHYLLGPNILLGALFSNTSVYVCRVAPIKATDQERVNSL
jgi:hypothetical protein